MDYQSFIGVRPSIRIRILVVDDDYMSLNIAATTLRSLKYEVLTAKHPFEALSTLRLMEGGIDLVVSDYHMPDMNGVQLQKRIHEEFKIPVIMMSVDNREYVVVECLRGGSKIFVLKPVSVEKVENVWQYVVANNKGKSPSAPAIDGANRVGNYLEFRQNPRPVSFSISCNRQNKEDGKNKNNKVVWTNALHTLFLQAINQIGLEKAVPKKILDLMKVPGLTRQHVASHLQKYRIFLKKVAERGLVKWNDPQKALNDAFALTMASNAQYHDMILSMPPSQFAQTQPKFVSSSSGISIGNNQNGATVGANSSTSHRVLNHGSVPSSTLGRATWKAAPNNSNPLQNANASSFMYRESCSNSMGGGLRGFGSGSRNNMFRQENRVIPKPFQSQQFGSGSLNSAWNGNPKSSCNIENGLTMHGNEHRFPTRLGLNSNSPNNPNNSSFNNQIGHGMPAKEHAFPAPLSRNPNNSSFRVLENEPTRLGLNSMSTNPNNSSFRVLGNEPTRLGLNSMSPNPNNSSFRVLENEPTRPGLNSMSTTPNNSSFRVLESEPTRPRLKSMSPNPNHSTSNDQIVCGNEQLVPPRLGLSGSYKPDNGFDIRVDSTKGPVLFENGMNLVEPETPGHCYINQEEINNNVPNSTPPLTKSLQEKSASNDIEVISPYVLDELEGTDMPEKPTLGDGGFDCLGNLDLLDLWLPQSNGDIDMVLESAPPQPLDQLQPTTNGSDADQNWDDDFIGSLLVDHDGPNFIEADQRSCCLP